MKLTFESSKSIGALLEELKAYFPDSLPINTSTSLEELRRLQGQQEVIQYINMLLDPEDED